ncbi:prephenate dehydrogenase [Brevibacterium album]|uniref:prephenate dehydrogenase n=1 Tax=Brevibacterium album TaxID=417948 RepID=UPI00041090BC|nr:prephenate dehydrogenase [Brevibacterium album]
MSAGPADPHLPARVHIVGAGLLGTSLGLALTRAGCTVTLADVSPTSARLAADLGAGSVGEAPPETGLVIVAAPPDVTAGLVVEHLRRLPEATVTDVASVKGVLLERVRRATERSELDRYIGSHPMAGRERSGATWARTDLFRDRPWVICSDADTPPDRLAQVEAVARAVGSTVLHLEPEFHDSSVARVSHAPQVVSSLMAARLARMPVEGVALAGQGLRDVTRIAASDPGLWTQILAGNAAEVRAVLAEFREDLDRVIDALALDPGALAVLAGALAAGNEGRLRIPGKHGQAPTAYATVTVVIGDEPGNLGRLFAEVGELGINIEDVRIDHATGRRLGSLDLFVLPAHAQDLVTGLLARGWRLPEHAEAELPGPTTEPDTPNEGRT